MSRPRRPAHATVAASSTRLLPAERRRLLFTIAAIGFAVGGAALAATAVVRGEALPFAVLGAAQGALAGTFAVFACRAGASD